MACVTEAGRGVKYRPAVNGIDTDARSYQKRFQKSEDRMEKVLFLNCVYVKSHG
jgi:hypothetical protein